MQDTKNNLSFVQAIAPAARIASVNGSGVDLANFNSATVVFNVGTITDGVHAPKIQESDDDAVFTDVVDADLIGVFADLASNTTQKVGYIGGKRYVRAVSTVTGATTGGVYGAVIVRGHARKYPIS